MKSGTSRELEMFPNKSRGRLITFCGLDGCGKTTMIRRLRTALEERGLPVALTKQPTDFVRKSAIFRTYMDTPEHGEYDYRSLSLLAASDRVQHSNRVIAPALAAGKAVISDRYFYSCLANLHARGYLRDRWIYEIARDIPQPDAAFFLDVEVETAVRRVRSREEEKDRYIDMELQRRLRQEYRELAAGRNGVLVPTNVTEDETFRRIWSVVEPLLEEKNARRERPEKKRGVRYA